MTFYTDVDLLRTVYSTVRETTVMQIAQVFVSFNHNDDLSASAIVNAGQSVFRDKSLTYSNRLGPSEVQHYGSVANMIFRIIAASGEVKTTKCGLSHRAIEECSARSGHSKGPSRARRHAFGSISLDVYCVSSCLNSPVSDKSKSKRMVMLTHWRKASNCQEIPVSVRFNKSPRLLLYRPLSPVISPVS